MDPEVIVAEFAYEVVDDADCVQEKVPCVFVLRVRDGLILESRDDLPPPPAGLS